jgi:hypothetical protein
LKNTEIKNPKKLDFILRILVKTEFKNSFSFMQEKSLQILRVFKVEKKISPVRFNPRPQGSYPLPLLSLPYPPPIASGA